jgi:hypothetical protein
MAETAEEHARQRYNAHMLGWKHGTWGKPCQRAYPSPELADEYVSGYKSGRLAYWDMAKAAAEMTGHRPPFLLADG